MTSALNAPKSVSSENPSKSVFQTNIPKLRFPEFDREWELKMLEEVSEINRGKSKHRPRDAAFLYGGKYPFVQTGDIKQAQLYLDKYTQTYSEAGLKQSKLWEENTLCITIAANIAETAILKIKACFPDSIIGLIPDPKKSTVLFIKYQFDKFKIDIQKLSQGVAQDNLNKEKLSKIEFNFPTLPEQQKIATFLTAVDAKIAHLSQKMSLLEAYKKGAMQGIFSQKHRLEGLKDDTDSVQSKSEKSANPCHLRFRQDNGNHYPDWEEKRLGEVALITTGSTPSTFNQDFYGGTKQFVSPADLKNNRYVLKTNTTLTELGFKQTRVIKKGSVLFVCIGSTIGKIGQVFEDCATNQQINALTALPNYNNDYIYSLLDYYGKSIKLLSGTQAVPQINKTVFSGVKLGFPSIEEQTKIANFLSAIDAKIDLVKTQLENTQAFKKGLLQQMFV